MGRLDGKVALITGAARGIGAATAKCFVAEGASVMLADRRADEVEGVKREIDAAHACDAESVELDVTSPEGWSAAVAKTVSTFGGLDILVNNAGIIRIAPIEECTLEMFEKVIDTNLIGTFLGIKAAIEPMKQRGGGSIVNLSSVQGLEGREGLPAYTASKFGIRGLSKTAAIELGPHGIRVNTIFPGPTKTTMTQRKGWADEDYDAQYGGYPLGRMAEATEIANAALFLASDESSFCTATELVADGGVSAGKPRS